jgi:hypothetical protein
MNLHHVFILMLALAAAVTPATGAAQSPAQPASVRAPGADWVGYVVPPYPSGWSELSGGCIGSVDDAGGPCHHSITVIQDAQSGMRMILGLEELKHFGKDPLWRIVAALEPDALFDRRLTAVHGTCQLRNVDDATVVAIVRYQDRAWLPAREAWRFDVPAGRLVPLRAADVRCANEGHGE